MNHTRHFFSATGKLVAALLCTAAAPTAHAGHGLNVIGFGSESLGMAGTDIAISRDTAAVNINPAGLTQLQSQGWDVYVSPFYTARLSHSDSYGNDRVKVDNPLGSVAAASYAQAVAAIPGLVIGSGLFVQGGTGFVYQDLPTRFGTRDDASSLFSVFKIASGFGYRASDQLSIGATLGIAYAQGRQKLFPGTSDADAGFFGIRFDGGERWTFNGTLGLQYRTTPELVVGAAYTSKTDLPLEGGSLTVNYEDLGLGRVKYRDAELRGLALPQTFGVGLAWRAQPEILLAAELEWVDWSDALRSSRLIASDPDGDVPEVLRQIDQTSPLNWRDQYSVSVGIAWDWTEKTVLRAGFDHVRNPSPKESSSPLLNIYQAGEITLGFGHKLPDHWLFEFAFQWQLPQYVTYTNPALPFGENARESFEVVSFTVGLGRRW